MSVKKLSSSDQVVLPEPEQDVQPDPLEQKTKKVADQALSPRTRSPAPSESSVFWPDPANLLTQRPANIFSEIYPREIFTELNYSATDEEWREIRDAREREIYQEDEIPARNFAMIKLAMKRLDPELFWQGVHHLNKNQLADVKIALKAFKEIADTVGKTPSPDDEWVNTDAQDKLNTPNSPLPELSPRSESLS